MPRKPVAVSAVWDGGSRRLFVTFDMDLVIATLDPANWTLVHTTGSMQPTAGVASGTMVTLQFASPAVPVSIEYDPPPFDVVGESGTAAEAFSMNL